MSPEQRRRERLFAESLSVTALHLEEINSRREDDWYLHLEGLALQAERDARGTTIGTRQARRGEVQRARNAGIERDLAASTERIRQQTAGASRGRATVSNGDKF